MPRPSLPRTGRSRPHPATLVVCVLLLALGSAGGAVAAGTIGSRDIVDGAVQTADLHKNAVTGPKIKKASVRSSDLRDGGVAPADLSTEVQDLIATAVTGPEGPQGPEGPPGPAGGATGPAGISGYEIVSETGSYSGAGTQQATVPCPDGKVALGGGVRSSAQLAVTSTYPTATGAKWVVGFTRTKGRGSYDATSYAICGLAS